MRGRLKDRIAHHHETQSLAFTPYFTQMLSAVRREVRTSRARLSESLSRVCSKAVDDHVSRGHIEQQRRLGAALASVQLNAEIAHSQLQELNDEDLEAIAANFVARGPGIVPEPPNIPEHTAAAMLYDPQMGPASTLIIHEHAALATLCDPQTSPTVPPEIHEHAAKLCDPQTDLIKPPQIRECTAKLCDPQTDPSKPLKIHERTAEAVVCAQQTGPAKPLKIIHEHTTEAVMCDPQTGPARPRKIGDRTTKLCDPQTSPTKPRKIHEHTTEVVLCAPQTGQVVPPNVHEHAAAAMPCDPQMGPTKPREIYEHTAAATLCDQQTGPAEPPKVHEHAAAEMLCDPQMGLTKPLEIHEHTAVAMLRDQQTGPATAIISGRKASDNSATMEHSCTSAVGFGGPIDGSAIVINFSSCGRETTYLRPADQPSVTDCAQAICATAAIEPREEGGERENDDVDMAPDCDSRDDEEDASAAGTLKRAVDDVQSCTQSADDQLQDPDMDKVSKRPREQVDTPRPRASLRGDETSLDFVSDYVLLEIFSKFGSAADLCHCALVCRRWRDLLGGASSVKTNSAGLGAALLWSGFDVCVHRPKQAAMVHAYPLGGLDMQPKGAKVCQTFPLPFARFCTATHTHTRNLRRPTASHNGFARTKKRHRNWRSSCFRVHCHTCAACD